MLHSCAWLRVWGTHGPARVPTSETKCPRGQDLKNDGFIRQQIPERPRQRGDAAFGPSVLNYHR